jgi:hypothetical protein
MGRLVSSKGGAVMAEDTREDLTRLAVEAHTAIDTMLAAAAVGDWTADMKLGMVVGYAGSKAYELAYARRTVVAAAHRATRRRALDG